MKFVYPLINGVFDTDIDQIHCLVIENQRFLYEILEDITNQINGMDGQAVISDQGKIRPMDKYAEVLQQFVPFDLNRKNLLNRISAELERNALRAEYYEQTAMLLSETEAHLMRIAAEYPCDISFSKIHIGAIIKAAGVEINSSYTGLAEKIIDYMELVGEFEEKKMFILVNLRSFISDEEAELFLETVLSHGYQVLMIESSERPRLKKERRTIIDKDLCEIL